MSYREQVLGELVGREFAAAGIGCFWEKLTRYNLVS